MASKYSKVALPAFQQEETFQDKVTAWKRMMFGENPEDANLSMLARELAEQKCAKDMLEEQVSEINIHIEALSQLIVEKMQAESLEKVGLSDGSTCYVSYEVYPSVKDKAALLEWVKKHKMAASLSLPWQTLRGLCNDLSVAGKPMPEGVECFLKTAARIRSNGKE